MTNYMVDMMFVKFLRRQNILKLLISIICFISFFSDQAHSKTKVYKNEQILSIKQNLNEGFSAQKNLLKDKFSTKIIKENKKLKIQNQRLTKERDFYIRKANLYSEMVKKLQHGVKIIDSGFHTLEFKNSHFTQDKENPSSSSSDSILKNKNKAELNESEEKNLY